jgi:plasmid stabilization system protein ParE
MREPKAVKSARLSYDFVRLYAWIADTKRRGAREAVIRSPRRRHAALGETSASWAASDEISRRAARLHRRALADRLRRFLMRRGILVLRILDSRRDIAALLGKKS